MKFTSLAAVMAALALGGCSGDLQVRTTADAGSGDSARADAGPRRDGAVDAPAARDGAPTADAWALWSMISPRAPGDQTCPSVCTGCGVAHF